MVRRILLLVGAVLIVAGVAFGDWDPSMSAKWVQMPDETEMGIDVFASYNQILADDFECTHTGAITDIHIWGSWLYDELPFDDEDAVTFTLSIHEDIPADQSPTGYSMPGDVLWYQEFQMGQFEVQSWALGTPEGWMYPPSFYFPDADYAIWQYNFPIPESMQFEQQGTPYNPVIYWLDVQAQPMDSQASFGWKTSRDHWNDNAVWGDGNEPYYGPWDELIYPPEHPYAGTPIDLAFVIVGEEGPDLDWGDAPDGPYPTLAGSNGASHVIDSEGPYLGSTADFPDPEPDGQPDSAAYGDDMFDGNDDENGVQIPILIAGTTQTFEIWVEHIFGDQGYLDAWFDFDGNGMWAADELAYSGWVGTGSSNISVNTPASAIWGKSFARFRINSNGPLPVDGPAPDGEVEDHEFRIVQYDAFKWVQPPDLTDAGIDIHATELYLLADDFLCTEPGRITEIWVWGSWYSDILPGGSAANVDFILSFHEDIPAEQSPDGYSIPGNVLWQRNFYAGDFTVQVEESSLQEGWMDPPDSYSSSADTTCWLYKFRVSPEDAFFQRGTMDEPIVYWLDVQAYPLDRGAFGWKTSMDHWNDAAVWGWGLEPYPGPWYYLRYPMEHPFDGQSIDLAFGLNNDPHSGVPDESVDERFGLLPNEPNPFTGTTTLRYSLAKSGNAKLEVFNVMGQVVSTLVDANQAAGPHATTWSGLDDRGRQLPAGIYFCRLTVGSESATQKMMYLK
ncbi:T9SS type A sorting domain-containing protein [Candidatus Eisenbacteria bacterium]|uniref:T9SS type A sorting domain-containing protein n=1 Tax=Eiseniibacteriota bacterium TaxID=2212470 RepID=A0ABV6YNH9_UNCEI